MKRKLIIGIFLLFSFSLVAQIQGDGGTMFSQRDGVHLIEFQKIEFPQPDLKKLRAEDAVNDSKGITPWRFGFNFDTELTLENSGTWVLLPSGAKIWFLEIDCKDAQTINLTFEKTTIPQGNELYVYNPDKTFILGKFTQKHLYEGQLGTELVPGSKVIIEYFVAPNNSANSGSLTVKTVTYGYRLVDEFQQKAFGGAGACEMNVNCSDGLPFSDQKRSVVMLVSGSNGFCTGALVNNTAYDGKPYVLTANHCYSNPASWVFRFNWESPNCTNPPTSPSFSSLSGAVLRARRTPSDFCLVEITGGLFSGTVPVAYNAYFAGWDRTGDNPTKSFSIHHPKGDIKKISFDDDISTPAQSSFGATTSESEGLWQVNWDRNTATEGGSSGSPLFNQDKRIIGQLWGGQSSCAYPTKPDFYGRFSKSWNPLGSNDDQQLAHWLDPSSSGALVIDGYEPGSVISIDGSLFSLNDATGTICGNTLTPHFKLTNLGQTVITSATISYGIDGVEDQLFNWSGNLSFLQSTSIVLPTLTSVNGNHTFSASLTAVNGGTDEVAGNNSVISTFHIIETPLAVTLNLTLDCYASENHWEIKNTNGDMIYRSPNYSNSDEGAHSYSLCLADECYTFAIYDAYNDGMSYCDSGSLTLLGPNSEILVSLNKQQGATFGASYSKYFCLNNLSVDALQNELSLYPNPTSGKLNWNSEMVQSVSVFNIHGQKVSYKIMKQNEQFIDLSDLVDGIYIVEFDYSNGSKVQRKIVIDK